MLIAYVIFAVDGLILNAGKPGSWYPLIELREWDFVLRMWKKSFTQENIELELESFHLSSPLLL